MMNTGIQEKINTVIRVPYVGEESKLNEILERENRNGFKLVAVEKIVTNLAFPDFFLFFEKVL